MRCWSTPSRCRPSRPLRMAPLFGDSHRQVEDPKVRARGCRSLILAARRTRHRTQPDETPALSAGIDPSSGRTPRLPPDLHRPAMTRAKGFHQTSRDTTTRLPVSPRISDGGGRSRRSTSMHLRSRTMAAGNPRR